MMGRPFHKEKQNWDVAKTLLITAAWKVTIDLFLCVLFIAISVFSSSGRSRRVAIVSD
jgi:hypothetical protein